MGFSNYDAFLNEATVNGNVQDWFFAKVTAAGGTGTAGRWYEYLTATGIPSAISLSGTAGVGTQLTRSTSGAMPLNSDVSSDTRHLLNMGAWTPASTIHPGVLILADFLFYYPSLVVTGTPTTLDNTATIPRYTDGVGVHAMCCVHTAIGAASPALTFTFTSVDTAGSTSSSQTGILTSPGNSAPTTTLFLSNGSPFLPIPSGKVGVKSVQSYTIGSGTTGTVDLVLFKPLAEIPLTAQYGLSEREFMFQLVSLPQIKDGACLGFILQVGGAMATSSLVMGRYQYAWGG